VIGRELVKGGERWVFKWDEERRYFTGLLEVYQHEADP
jgi:hypothetical protein